MAHAVHNLCDICPKQLDRGKGIARTDFEKKSFIHEYGVFVLSSRLYTPEADGRPIALIMFR